MAGDESEAKHGASVQTEPTADVKPAEAAPGALNPLHAEWTASDAREPLEAAPVVPNAPILHDSEFVAQEPGFLETGAHEAAGHEAAVHQTGIHETSIHDVAPHEPVSTAPGSGEVVAAAALTAGALPPEDEGHAPKAPEDQTVAREPTPEVTASASAASAQNPTPDVPPARSRRSIMPLAASIVLGAIIGAGSAYYAGHIMPGHGTDQANFAALESRVGKLEKAAPRAGTSADPASANPAALKETLASLTSKVVAAEAAAKAAAASAAEAARPGGTTAPAASDAKLAALQASVATLEAQLHLAATAAQVKTAQDKLAAIEAGVSGLQKDGVAVHDQVTAIQSQITALQSQAVKTGDLATALKTDVGSLGTAQKSLEAKFTNSPAYAVIADSLMQQIVRGAPFVTQVNALESLGIDSAQLGPLRAPAPQGVATVKVLSDKFDALSAGLVAAAHKLPPNASFWDRLKDGAGSLVSVHRDGETSGAGLASRIAAIKASLGHGDVAGALTTWNLLPADAKSRPDAVAWGALAKAQAEASAAARAIENDAMASLGVKKS